MLLASTETKSNNVSDKKKEKWFMILLVRRHQWDHRECLDFLIWAFSISHGTFHNRNPASHSSHSRKLKLSVCALAAGKCQWVIDSELHHGGETRSGNAKKNRPDVNTSTRFPVLLLDRSVHLWIGSHIQALPTGGRILLHSAQTYASKMKFTFA